MSRSRQRTLEATIAWSYDLLDDEEQRILRSLSVFAGGCTLTAAEAVAGADLDVLESLLDKSLIRQRIDETGRDRYWMLETIREYSARRLALCGETEEANARHTRLLLGLAGEIEAPVGRFISDAQLNRFAADRADFRLAQTRAIAEGDAASAVRFIRCLGRVLVRLGPVSDGYPVARASLALHGGAVDDRAYALVRTAGMAMLSGELESADGMLTEAEVLFEQLGDAAGLADSTAWRSHLAGTAGDHDQAIAFAEKQGAIARELGDPDIASYSNLILGDALMGLAVERDDQVAARRSRALLEAERAELYARESSLHEINLFARLALVLIVLGEHAESIALAQRSMRQAVEVGVRWLMEYHLTIGVATGGRGDYRGGVRLVSVALEQYRKEGIALEDFMTAFVERFERSARAALGDGTYETAVREGEAFSDEDAIELALSVGSDD